MAQTSMKRLGNVTAPATRETVTVPSSSGCCRTSRTSLRNSGSSSDRIAISYPTLPIVRDKRCFPAACILGIQKIIQLFIGIKTLIRSSLVTRIVPWAAVIINLSFEDQLAVCSYNHIVNAGCKLIDKL